MGPVKRSKATLRIMGEDLIPEQITSALGAQPTAFYSKGDPIPSKTPNLSRKFGAWRLQAQVAEPENLDGQIREILDQLTPDLTIWNDISRKFEIDLFCGLFMGSSNEGVSISPETLLAIGQRGIELGLDIYEGDSKDA